MFCVTNILAAASKVLFVCDGGQNDAPFDCAFGHCTYRQGGEVA